MLPACLRLSSQGFPSTWGYCTGLLEITSPELVLPRRPYLMLLLVRVISHQISPR
jgi:hypothetical protein